MNLKLAKKLRKIARSFATYSKDPAKFMETRYTENESHRKIFVEYEQDVDGNTIFNDKGLPTLKQRHHLADGTVSVIKDCFRGQYRRMKRNIKSGQMLGAK